jgi:hypothetical protein
MVNWSETKSYQSLPACGISHPARNPNHPLGLPNRKSGEVAAAAGTGGAAVCASTRGANVGTIAAASTHAGSQAVRERRCRPGKVFGGVMEIGTLAKATPRRVVRGVDAAEPLVIA